MTEQNINIDRNEEQNRILDLEKRYMDELESIIKSDAFISDLKRIEREVQEKYSDLQFIWGKKNKIKEASERLLTHHMYTSFPNARTFYPSPISCDIALILEDVILNIDVKTIDKNGNSGELNSTQLEHNQTSFINNPINPTDGFSGYKIRSHIETKDLSGKPILTFLLKIGYIDNGEGNFNFLNTNNTRYPNLVLTCIPNGILSNLFNHDLCSGFKTYTYFGKDDNSDEYYKPKKICNVDSFKDISVETKFRKIRNTVSIPDNWKPLIWNANRIKKIGFYDATKEIVWQIQNQGKGVFLKAVKFGNTMRFKDKWLEKRYDSHNEPWKGQRKYYNIFGSDSD